MDEDKIDNMSITFFNSVLATLGKRVNYDAVVNYAGNSFAKDSWKIIQDANPLIKQKPKQHSFMALFDEVKMPVVKNVKQAVLPGNDWFKIGETQTGDITAQKEG